MSVQFGKCNFDGKPVDPHDLEEARRMLAPYGPDREGYLCHGNVGIIYRALHSAQEARRETQPQVAKTGTVITWDGRLDNRRDLIERLHGELSSESTDLEIVAGAYDRWGNDALPELIGDWALSIWNPCDQSLLLAKDFVGTRHLYYAIENDQVAWCTILDPLVLCARRPFKLEEEFIAGWLAFLPATHLTPYVGIHAVPPSAFVRLARGTRKVTKYWDFDPGKRIVYRTDDAYEEHFRAVFSQSVRRRLRSDSPVLAELSGGMDSSSIVCMADEIARHSPDISPTVETVSYYDDSEPNWNERPYFSKVEEKRGHTGCHIAIKAQPLFDGQYSDSIALTPSSLSRNDDTNKPFAEFMNSRGIRVLLSGIGGDEVTGGVPTPTPELANLLTRGRFQALARQLKLWALNKRRPWIHLFVEVLRELFPSVLGVSRRISSAPWLNPSFANRHRLALRGYDRGLDVFGALPSFQESLRVLDGIRRQLGCVLLPREPLYERRYPYLDRDLLEFLYAVPREQVVRPGQRRSLMRRALVGIVPDEVLERRRKAYVAHGPAVALSVEWPSIRELTERMVASSIGIVNATAFRDFLRKAGDGEEVPILLLMRTIDIEFWLRNLKRNGLLGHSVPRRTEGLANTARGRIEPCPLEKSSAS
jgi:asparagine synthase (glutamine-hydrolysing)